MLIASMSVQRKCSLVKFVVNQFREHCCFENAELYFKAGQRKVKYMAVSEHGLLQTKIQTLIIALLGNHDKRCYFNFPHELPTNSFVSYCVKAFGLDRLMFLVQDFSIESPRSSAT